MLKASVRGVYGVLGPARRRFISHSLSERSSETGESFICISSTSTREAARWEAVGISDQTPSKKLQKNVALETSTLDKSSRVADLEGWEGTYAMTTVTANVPLAIKQ